MSFSRDKLPTSRDMLPTSRGTLPSSIGKLPPSRGKLPTSRSKLPTTRGKLPTSRGKLPTSRGKLPTSEYSGKSIQGAWTRNGQRHRQRRQSYQTCCYSLVSFYLLCCQSQDTLFLIVKQLVNPSHATGFFLYYLKTSENQRFFNVFRSYGKRPVARDGLNDQLIG